MQISQEQESRKNVGYDHKVEFMQLLCSNVESLEKWMSGASLKIEKSYGACIHNKSIVNNVQSTNDNRKKILQIDFPLSDVEIYFSEKARNTARSSSSDISIHIHYAADKHLHSDLENVLRT